MRLYEGIGGAYVDRRKFIKRIRKAGYVILMKEGGGGTRGVGSHEMYYQEEFDSTITVPREIKFKVYQQLNKEVSAVERSIREKEKK